MADCEGDALRAGDGVRELPADADDGFQGGDLSEADGEHEEAGWVGV